MDFAVFSRPEFIIACAAVFTGVCYITVNKGAQIYNIGKEDLSAGYGSLKRLTASLWAISLAALAVFIIITNYVGFTAGALREFISMYQEDNEGAYIPELICVAAGDLIYTMLLLPCWFIFKKAITDRDKRAKLFLFTLAALPGVWIAMMAIIVFVM